MFPTIPAVGGCADGRPVRFIGSSHVMLRADPRQVVEIDDEDGKRNVELRDGYTLHEWQDAQGNPRRCYMEDSIPPNDRPCYRPQ